MNDGLEAGGDKGGQAGGERGWLSSVPENLRGHEAFQDVEKLSDVFQRYTDLTVASKDSLRVPGENATDEDRAAFYQRLGRPGTAPEYQFAKPEGLPEGVYDETVEGGFKQIAFDRGLSQQQAADLHKWYWDTVNAGLEQERQATEKALETLKGEWKGDAFKENSEIAVRAFERFGGEDAKKFIEETRINGVALGNHPMFLKIFAEIGKKISDDTLTDERTGSLDAVGSEEQRARKRFPNTEFRT